MPKPRVRRAATGQDHRVNCKKIGLIELEVGIRTVVAKIDQVVQRFAGCLWELTSKLLAFDSDSLT